MAEMKEYAIGMGIQISSGCILIGRFRRTTL